MCIVGFVEVSVGPVEELVSVRVESSWRMGHRNLGCERIIIY